MAMTLVQDRVGSQYRVRIAERLVGSTALKQADKLLRPMLMAARPENTEAQIVLYVPDSPGTAAIEQTLIGPASATVSYFLGLPRGADSPPIERGLGLRRGEKALEPLVCILARSPAGTDQLVRPRYAGGNLGDDGSTPRH